jgi:hypothetical protein
MNREQAAELLDEAESKRQRHEVVRERGEQWLAWIERTRQNEYDEDEDDLAGVVLALALGAVEDVIDQHVATLTETARREAGELRRRLIVMENAHAAERRRRVADAAASRKTIATLETGLTEASEAIAEARKKIAALGRELAQQRALARMVQDRRSHPPPHGQRATLEAARRRTDQAVKGH